MGLILRVLSGPFGAAALWGVGILLAGMAATIGVQYVQKAGLRAEVAELEADKAALEGAVKRQNDEIDRFAGECKAKADQAVTEALRALAAPEPPAAGPGPAELNRWLQERSRAR